MIGDLLVEAERKMEHSLDHLASEFSTVRTGRANPQILHRVEVPVYGTQTALQQLASFSVPEPRLLVVNPYDKSAIGVIEKAIRSSDLGLNPSSDGTVIRIAFPPLTEERRRELIRLVRHMAEEARVAVRNVRRHTKSDVEVLHGEISDDDIRRAEKGLQELTDQHVLRIDEMLAHKEAELMEV